MMNMMMNDEYTAYSYHSKFNFIKLYLQNWEKYQYRTKFWYICVYRYVCMSVYIYVIAGTGTLHLQYRRYLESR